MNIIQEKIISILRQIVSFLERHKNKPINLNPSPIHSLAPKLITDDKELKSIEPYLNNLKHSIDTDGVNNIALTGSYGSGKSTILKTFQNLYPEYEYLNISLASFKETEDTVIDLKNSDKNSGLERRLEISILQQMFYHVEPSVIPDSRFKRIANLTWKKLFFPTLFFILFCISSLLLFRFKYIDNVNPKTWNYDYTIDFLTVSISLIFLIGLGLFMKKIYGLFKNSKINKLNIKGELELGDSIDKSVFNEHLEEILYFFEKTNFNVVIIEDVDRFDSTAIFTKLREINILINNSIPISRAIKFIYAIKDEMFKDKNERVKFFEFIIPVIPFINPSNASDQLTKLITNAKLEGQLSSDFTSDIVTFIDDIDMRLLINIFHEYQLYKSILSTELNQDSLFSIIVYKNLYPDDFGDLQKRRGKLYSFFHEKPNYRKAIIEKFIEQINQINSEITFLENEIDKPIMELRAVYINRLVSKLDKFNAFFVNENNISLLEALTDENFKLIKQTKSVSYIEYTGTQVYKNYSYVYDAIPSNSPIDSRISFGEIEKEVSNKLTYNQREKILLDRANSKITILKGEKGKLKQQINEVESLSVKELFEIIDTEEYIGDFKDNSLVRNLLLNGYINEHYDDYISLFHEVNLTKEDFVFERKIKSGYSLPFTYSLTRTENVIKKLPTHHFTKDSILNNDVLIFLMNNRLKYPVQHDYFFKTLSIDREKQFDFIREFVINNDSEAADFIEELCNYKTSFWQYLSSHADLSDESITAYLCLIFDFAKIDSIYKFNSIESLESYVADMDHFFKFCLEMSQTSTIQSFIKKKNILFKRLDVPKLSQNKLFDIIYKNNLYEITKDNINSIIKGSNEQIDESKLDEAHYTTLLKSNLEHLLNYISNNLESYTQQVLLLSEQNTKEEEETIMLILNQENVSKEVRIHFLKSQQIEISSLELIHDLDLKQEALTNSKILPVWENVFDYYSAIDEVFDDTLISYLDTNCKVLSEQKIKNIKDEPESAQKISDSIVLAESLKIQTYSSLLSSIPFTYNSLNFELLSNNKIEALLAKGLLNLTLSNFNSLKAKSTYLPISLIKVHQDKFKEKISEISLDSSDWLNVYESSEISLSNKVIFIEHMDETHILNNKQVADIVGYLLPLDEQTNLSYEAMTAIFSANRSLEKKINLLNVNFEKYDDSQLKMLIEKLGEDYVKVFLKKHKPTFPLNNSNVTLFGELKKRDLIIRYEGNGKKNEIKVFAKY